MVMLERPLSNNILVLSTSQRKVIVIFYKALLNVYKKLMCAANKFYDSDIHPKTAGWRLQQLIYQKMLLSITF